ncbi:MAG: hypothetical protein Q4D34_04790 [Eggerthellaceae bacterium]|nr:hypothetical protein [Eggerthellaceae bacterium]
MSDYKCIQQVSVYLENKEGTLVNLLEIVGAKGVNLLAMCIADTTDFGIARLVVAAEDQSILMDELDAHDMFARINDVVGIGVEHKPGGLAKVLATVRGSGQQIEYAYSIISGGEGQAAIVMQTSDNEACMEALSKAGITLLSNDDLK